MAPKISWLSASVVQNIGDAMHNLPIRATYPVPKASQTEQRGFPRSGIPPARRTGPRTGLSASPEVIPSGPPGGPPLRRHQVRGGRRMASGADGDAVDREPEAAVPADGAGDAGEKGPTAAGPRPAGGRVAGQAHSCPIRGGRRRRGGAARLSGRSPGSPGGGSRGSHAAAYSCGRLPAWFVGSRG